VAHLAGLCIELPSRGEVRLKPDATFAGRGGRCAAACREIGDPGWTGGSVPSRPNNQTLSPRAEPSSALPAENASTYCLPLYSNVLAGACIPAPVWNSQSCFPLAESSAVRRPSERPTNSSPPAVASVPL
jgi:hypothetical protein